jgi:hypothetical protein
MSKVFPKKGVHGGNMVSPVRDREVARDALKRLQAAA